MEKLYLLCMDDGDGHTFPKRIFDSEESAKEWGESFLEPFSDGTRMYVSYDIMEFTKIDFGNEIHYEFE